MGEGIPDSRGGLTVAHFTIGAMSSGGATVIMLNVDIGITIACASVTWWRRARQPQQQQGQQSRSLLSCRALRLLAFWAFRQPYIKKSTLRHSTSTAFRNSWLSKMHTLQKSWVMVLTMRASTRKVALVTSASIVRLLSRQRLISGTSCRT